MPTPDKVYQGGCFCGRVRYRFETAPMAVSHCHCDMCRRLTGAPFITWMTITPDTFSFTNEQPAHFRSSDEAQRIFCSHCGTSLGYINDKHPEELDISAATLDDPSMVTPDDHLWIGSKLEWIEMADDLPRLEAAHWAAGYPKRQS